MRLGKADGTRGWAEIERWGGGGARPVFVMRLGAKTNGPLIAGRRQPSVLSPSVDNLDRPIISFYLLVKLQSTRLQQLDATFAALADPTRRAILKRLARGAAPMGELARPFGMTWPAITKHVKALERARLVRRIQDGRVHRIQLEGP